MQEYRDEETGRQRQSTGDMGKREKQRDREKQTDRLGENINEQ